MCWRIDLFRECSNFVINCIFKAFTLNKKSKLLNIFHVFDSLLTQILDLDLRNHIRLDFVLGAWPINVHFWNLPFDRRVRNAINKRENAVVQIHDDVIKWKHFPRYWPFVRGIHRSPVNSPRKGQWRGTLMFSLICVWINGWVNNREAGDLRHYRTHYDVTVVPRNKNSAIFGTA